MRNVRVLVGLIVITIGVVGMILTWNNYTETRNVAFEYIVDNDDIHSIHLQDDIASIEVLPAPGADIIISWEENVNLKANQLTIDENGNQLEIKRESKGFGIMLPTLNKRKNNVKLYVPADKLVMLTIKNALGSVLVRDIQVEDLNVQTDVQRIVIENVEANNIEATTSVGSIEIENSTGSIFARSNVGSVDVDVKEIIGNMNLRSDVGSVTLTTDEQQDNVSFSGSSELGSVRIFGERTSTLADYAEFEVHLQTDVGSIEVHARH